MGLLGDGITNAEVYDVAASGRTFKLIAGTQDNGTILLFGGFSISRSGDISIPIRRLAATGLVAIDPTDDLKLYAMVQDGSSLVLSRNGGTSFGSFGGLGTDCNNYNMTFYFQLDPTQTTRVWASCHSLVTRDINGKARGGFSIYSSRKAPGQVVRSAVDPGGKLVYAGLADGRLFAGAIPHPFKKLFQHPNGLNVTDMEIDPKHRNGSM